MAGIFHSIYSAFNASLMQMKAEPAYRSRVVSLQTMTWGLTPFAGLAMGKMIDHWGAPNVVGGVDGGSGGADTDHHAVFAGAAADLVMEQLLDQLKPGLRRLEE